MSILPLDDAHIAKSYLTGSELSELIETAFFKAYDLDEQDLVRVWKEGDELIRKKEVLDFFHVPGRVQIKLRAQSAEPTVAQWNIKEIADSDWRHVVEQLGNSALSIALVLAGGLPRAIAGSALVPASMEFATLKCAACSTTPCVHRAVLVKKLLKAVEADPYVLLQLRGRGREELLAELWTKRRWSGSFSESRTESRSHDIEWQKFFAAQKEVFAITYSLKADELPGSLFTRLDTLPLDRLAEDAEQWFHQAYLEIARRAQAFGISLQKQL